VGGATPIEVVTELATADMEACQAGGQLAVSHLTGLAQRSAKATPPLPRHPFPHRQPATCRLVAHRRRRAVEEGQPGNLLIECPQPGGDLVGQQATKEYPAM
jgi:hypothetical protein